MFPTGTRSSVPTEGFSRFTFRPSVLYNWKASWTHDPGWPPWNSFAHGIHHRIFTEDEEKILADEILNASIVPGRQFAPSIF
jgi:hypothetical protein